jgi:hypothetical protein
MYYSWGSMLRTVRAAVAVMILGGIGLTVPPQTRDMLAFLDNGRFWPALSFQLAMVVLAGSAWFWSRAALAARFGIDDDPQLRPAAPDFDWRAYTWLPRLMLVASFLVGAAIAFMSRSPWSIAGAIGLAALGIILVVVRRRGPPVDLPPAPRGRLGEWIRGGARLGMSAAEDGAQIARGNAAERRRRAWMGFHGADISRAVARVGFESAGTCSGFGNAILVISSSVSN